MRDCKILGDEIYLAYAKIDGTLDIAGSTFYKDLNATSLQVSKGLTMDGASFKGQVILLNARVDGIMNMDNSTFDGTLIAESIHVLRTLFMRYSKFTQPVNLKFSHISGDLDLSGSELVTLDMSGAIVGQELRLSGRRGAAKWRHSNATTSVITLRNARIGTLQDSIQSWPDRVDLEGFSYEHLGGFTGPSQSNANSRTITEWISWLQKSTYAGKSFDPGPYTYLARILTVSGKRDYAADLQFAAREAERAEAWANGDYGRWAWLSFLRWFCGYGIGYNTFVVLVWVAMSTLIAVIVLQRAPAARSKGFFWCIGASIERLLPIIELNKEYPCPASAGSLIVLVIPLALG